MSFWLHDCHSSHKRLQKKCWWCIIVQAQRRAAGNRSEHKYSKKYVFISKNMTFGPLGHVLTLLKGPPNSYFFNIFFKHNSFKLTIVKLCCWRLAINWNNVQGGQDFTTLAVLWLRHTYNCTWNEICTISNILHFALGDL